MDDREAWLSHTFVELADTLVTGFDVVEFLSLLAERTVELLEASEVGLLLAEPRGNLRFMAASTERVRILELFEVQSEDGPCQDCYRSGLPLVNESLHRADDRWPRFASKARSLGFETVHALPLRLRDQVIGAANVLHETAYTIPPSDARLAQALVDVATIGILQERAVHHATELAEQLRSALNTRVLIEQAKGVLAERLSIRVEDAFSLLRRHARNNNLRMSDVAESTLDGSLPVEHLASQRSDSESGPA